MLWLADLLHMRTYGPYITEEDTIIPGLGKIQ